MQDVLEPILPQVPVEGIAVHIARAGLSMGDTAEARLMPDGRVGIYARVRQSLLGVIPRRRIGYLGHLGPVAGQIVAPALLDGAPLRLRIVQLTPEHLAGAGAPEIEISVWGDPRLLVPFLNVPDIFLPPDDRVPLDLPEGADADTQAEPGAEADLSSVPPLQSQQSPRGRKPR
ncbi:hypothetical protein [Xinfangfangia pollutisoli]|uniref:hypothetical protein n=1 Tax=Xinfangfangia pollutisoli TaxID=2865960 RepID=UPI001CD813C4|nr:hypothetical protein [Xinfangfangia pollutisoli]